MWLEFWTQPLPLVALLSVAHCLAAFLAEPTLLLLACCSTAIPLLLVIAPKALGEISVQIILNCLPISVAFFWLYTLYDPIACWTMCGLPAAVYAMTKGHNVPRSMQSRLSIALALVAAGAGLHCMAVFRLGLLKPIVIWNVLSVFAFAVCARHAIKSPANESLSIPSVALSVYVATLPQVLVACAVDTEHLARWTRKFLDPQFTWLIIATTAVSILGFVSCLTFHRKFDQTAFFITLGCAAVGGYILHAALTTNIPWVSLFGALLAVLGFAIYLHTSAMVRAPDVLRQLRQARSDLQVVSEDEEEMETRESSEDKTLASLWPSLPAISISLFGSSATGTSLEAANKGPPLLNEVTVSGDTSSAPSQACSSPKVMTRRSSYMPDAVTSGEAASSFGFVDRPPCCLPGYSSSVDQLVAAWDSPRVKEDLFQAVLEYGLSPSQRSPVWRTVAGLQRTMEKNAGQYQSLLLGSLSATEQEAIELDLHRLFPNHVLFRDAARSPNLERVRHVLTAFALRCPTMGYCQGMAYVVATILMQFPDEEECFWMYATLMEKHGLGYLYEDNLSDLSKLCEVTTAFLPAPIRDHLEQIGLLPASYAMNWYLTLFSGSFVCWEFVMLVWDLVWMTSPEAMLPLRVVLALHSHFAAEVMSCKDLGGLTLLLQRTIPEQLAHTHVLRSAVSLQTLRKRFPFHQQLAQMKMHRQRT